MQKANIELQTVQLTPKDFDRAADLLTEAFYHNPAHVYIDPNENTRANLLKWAMIANLILNLAPPKPVGQSFTLVEADKPPGIREVKAMGFWYPPQRASLGLINKIKSGRGLSPLKFGKASYPRLVEVMSAFDEIEKKVSNGKQAWFLNNMAVAKELRGTGVGTKVLKHQLQTVVEPSGFPAILMTQREANVTFYRRLGFGIADKSTVGTGKYAFTNWCMMRHSNELQN